MESQTMTGWWMSPNVWMQLPLLLGIENQSSYEHPGHIFIALPYPGPILIALSCLMSYRFTHKPHWSLLIELLWVIYYT